MDGLFNAIGIIGMLMMLAAYFLQQYQSITGKSGLYLWLNMIGSLALMLSLLRFWNLASFLLEVAWAAISFYGLWKFYRSGAYKPMADHTHE